jgi:competence protein ComEC
VLAVESGGRRILLTGDLEGAGMARLLAQPSYDCDVLLAPHHGSPRSNPPGIAAWSHPEWVVISGGRSSDRAEPVAEAYRQRGAEVFHTAYDGAVRFRFLEDRIDAACWTDGQWQSRASASGSP